MKFFILLLAFSAVSPFDRYSSSYRSTGDGAIKIIEDPSQSIIIGNNEFFWDGYYIPTLGRPVHCEIKVESEEWPLGEFRFPNGSKPYSLHYACQFGARCARLSCLNDNVWVPAVISLIMVVLFVGCIFKICCSNPDHIPEEYELAPPIPVYLKIDQPLEGETLAEDLIEGHLLTGPDGRLQPLPHITISVADYTQN